MKCEKCNSDKVGLHDSNASKTSKRMKCRDCGHSWLVPKDGELVKPKLGMTIEQFRSKHDVDFIVAETLKLLDKNVVYEKSDLYKLTKLSPSTPGLGAALEAQSEYYGKTGGKPYFSHPETIKMLKDQAKLT